MRIDRSEQIAELAFDDAGLIPVVAQHAATGEILMLAWANAEALARTLETRSLWLYSRSRAELWHKGATSGNTQQVVSLHADCDRDALVARVLPAGPACHTGSRSCFEAPPTLAALADRIAERAGEGDESGSYTRRLLADENLRLKKLGEEAVELALACAAGDAPRVREEAADLFYHAMVAAYGSAVTADDILQSLERRRAAGM
jgi:phosphoribosyl-AMP cyclohydrolase / phosphoribosyl-ATP pyrophosphohydrolase